MMTDIRRWQLDSTAPYALQLAADARLSRTDYTDDQVWELLPGTGDSPALALQTRYGGRVGLVSLVPMWLHDGRTIYQAQTYANPPVITAFAPGYAQAEGKLIPDLLLKAEYWVMESHAVGGRFTLHNTSAQPVTLRLDLFGHVIAEKKEQPLAIISLSDGTNALSLGRLRGLEPVIVLENANAEIFSGSKPSPKVGVDLTIPPGDSTSLRWAHAGLRQMAASLERAQFWLTQDWDAAFEQIKQAAQAIPIIETGNAEHDATIAFSYHQLMQSFLKPTEHLPFASFVASRQPGNGFSPRGDGSDHDRGWSGQTPQLAYMVGLAAATVSPQFAQGILENYLAGQAEDGSVDAKPGLGGQRQEILCPPLLARLAWGIYQQTHDTVFLANVFPRLLEFFNRWMETDLDRDGDILPEWQDERQTGYVFWPTFGVGQPWAQNAIIRRVSSPDLAAYLLSEAVSLREMARTLENVGAYELDGRVFELQHLLENLWYDPENRYAYHDRDSHHVTSKVTVLEGVPAAEEQLPALKLSPPARLLVRVSGGTGKPPRASLYLEGLDADGNTIGETVDLGSFAWSYGNGVYTSRNVYAMIDRVRFEGLSRVYRLNVHTVDLTRLDINAVSPLWSLNLPEYKVNALASLLADESHFLRPSGLSIVSAQDENFDAGSANGGGGTWAFWTTLIGEGLIESGYPQHAAELLRRLLNTQTQVLKEQKRFSEFYHSDKPIGLGEDGYLSGIVPLYLLMRVLGVCIINSGEVWTGGPFAWGAAVTIQQHGVTVQRSAEGTQMQFPSGHQAAFGADADWQAVVDPEPVTSTPDFDTFQSLPERLVSTTVNRVIIEVDHDSEG